MNYAQLEPAFAECLVDQYVRLSPAPPVIVVTGPCNSGKSCVLRTIERELQMELQPYQYEVHWRNWRPSSEDGVSYMAAASGQLHRLIASAMQQQKLLLIEVAQSRRPLHGGDIRDAMPSYSLSACASLILQADWCDGRFFIDVIKDRYGQLPKRSEFTLSRARAPHEILARPA